MPSLVSSNIRAVWAKGILKPTLKNRRSHLRGPWHVCAQRSTLTRFLMLEIHSFSIQYTFIQYFMYSVRCSRHLIISVNEVDRNPQLKDGP